MGTVTETPAAAEVVIDSEEIMQALINVDFELLGTKLVAEYYNGDNSEYFLLMPTEEESNGITIDKMLTDISMLLGIEKNQLDTNELQKSLNSLNSGITDFSQIKVVLKMAYFYIEAEKDKKKKTEYAFHFMIDTSGFLPESFKLLNIYRVGFAVWNTGRSQIVEKMNLYKAQDLLG